MRLSIAAQATRAPMSMNSPWNTHMSPTRTSASALSRSAAPMSTNSSCIVAVAGVFFLFSQPVTPRTPPANTTARAAATAGSTPPTGATRRKPFSSISTTTRPI